MAVSAASLSAQNWIAISAAKAGPKEAWKAPPRIQRHNTSRSGTLTPGRKMGWEGPCAARRGAAPRGASAAAWRRRWTQPRGLLACSELRREPYSRGVRETQCRHSCPRCGSGPARRAAWAPTSAAATAPARRDGAGASSGPREPCRAEARWAHQDLAGGTPSPAPNRCSGGAGSPWRSSDPSAARPRASRPYGAKCSAGTSRRGVLPRSPSRLSPHRASRAGSPMPCLSFLGRAWRGARLVW